MNFVFLILTTLCVIRVNGNGLLRMQNSSLSRQIIDKCDLTARPQCSSDCSKILACVSRIETPIFSINCTDSTPYCDKGHCVATPGNCSTNAQTSSFLCTSAGVFPEPTDCTKSHHCSGVGAQSILTKCPYRQIFDSKSKTCIPRSSNNRRICHKISCDGVENDFVIFPANPDFYAYCFTSASGVQHTYMYKCDDEINKVFDIKTKKCRFNCKSIGYYADPYDCSSYYICNGLKFASRHAHCPPNYFFNGTVCLNSNTHCPTGSLTIDATTTTTTTTPMPIPTTTTPMPVPIVNNSMAADEIAVSTTEEVVETTTLSSTIETLDTTTLPSTIEKVTTTESMTTQTEGLQMATSTKKPSGPIWKHMGLISVRVERFLNLI